MNPKQSLKRLLRRILFRTPMKPLLVHRYEYFFWPRELNFLCEQLTNAVEVNGNFVEIGCARGGTTVFLNKHLDCLELWEGKSFSGRDYICIDTFAGFVEEHIRHEQTERGKEAAFEDFGLNDMSWFEAMLRQNGVKRARAITADAAEFDYRSIAPIAFALLDVDLYVPIARALPKLYEALSPGGIIVVDDCQPNQIYDGARQAYAEFVEKIGMAPRYEHRKFGLIQKPANPLAPQS